MSWTWAALMPHPPIIVPDVGRGREKDAAETLRGTEAICARIREINSLRAPEVLVVLSPHEAYTPNALYINAAPRLSGSLQRFGAPAVRSELATAREDLDDLVPVLSKAGITLGIGDSPDITADHGALVPLYFLADTFSEGALPKVILANPIGLTPMQSLQLGKALRRFSNGKKWALLASGDLSHRLKYGAPSGYHPDGKVFDQAVVDAVSKGDPGILTGLDASVLQNAGECGLRSALVLLGLAEASLELFSYEGPFGVGYCNALWPGEEGGGENAAPGCEAASGERKNGGAKASRPQPRVAKITLVPRPGTEKPGMREQAGMIAIKHAGSAAAREAARSAPEYGHPYARLARMTVTALLEGRPLPSDEDIAGLVADKSLWDVHKGCFVSIKNKDGSLRGCIGSFGPTQPDLAREIMVNAVSASTRDPRFPAMKAAELDTVDISVDVLNTPELLEDGMELDPAVWGVIVSKGGQRGLLLPDLPSVTSVAQQLTIASQKGGITDLAEAEIRRFTISRYYERSREEEK